MAEVLKGSFSKINQKLNKLKQRVPKRNFLVKNDLVKILNAVNESKFPSERETLQESGIYSYKSHDKKSFNQLIDTFPKKSLVNAPKLVGKPFTYLYTDIQINKPLKFQKITPNIVRHVLDKMIKSYKQFHHDEKADYEFMIKDEKKREKANNNKISKNPKSKPKSKEPKKSRLWIPPKIAPHYSIKDAIRWHKGETKHTGMGFVVIGVYNPKSIRPFFIPRKVARYKHPITPNDGMWVSKFDLENLSQKRYGIKYIMSLRTAFRFGVNPYWQIIDLNAKIEPQIDNFCFCEMLNGVGNGSNKPYLNQLLDKLK